ncbi:MAG: oligopeptide transporter, OPT family [Acidobacteria bacterium]|nr:oligopeptide transporter, OPT family [Acidobacteriota bacterium]
MSAIDPNSKLHGFEPYIPADRNIPEFSVLPIIVGTVLGMIFGASSLYLVLKVGLTVSASIPVGVISITLFKILHKLGSRDATILENNIVQTAGSAGESIAFGVGVTMPAILILGFDLEIMRVTLVAILGGLLGILMMIPLRRALIVQQHGLLKYPEGTACAEVLKAGADPLSKENSSDEAKRLELEGRKKGTIGAKTIFAGFGLGLVYQSAMAAFKGWRDIPEKVFGPPFKAASVGAEISPALLGVGYIIGPRIASIMCAGGVLAYLVLIPMIAFFGEGHSAIIPPGTIPINQMSASEIRGAYVLYIGAGAVAAGGIISVFRALPTIWHGLREGLKDFGGTKVERGPKSRTENDLSMKVVLIGCLALIAVIAVATPLYAGTEGWTARIGSAILIVVFGFLFVTVSSRLTGEIGSSSNPISGMTVATLLGTCIVFVLIGWEGAGYYVSALSIGAIVCIASSNGGTVSQSLKTGFLVGATPKAQQIAILVGSLASAIILGPILLKLNEAATVYVPVKPETGIRADVSKLHDKEKLEGAQAESDTNEYYVYHHQDDAKGLTGKYLLNENGEAVWLVDPGINGAHNTRPDGTKVSKFDAPKATLMSYIIKGILNRQLPWGLVLLGVMIAIVLEMSGIPSLAFAVGVYLPLSSSTPILVGGIVRWGVDRWLAKKPEHQNLTEEELQAEGDKSPGVLMASGYIAGGAIAGIIIAFIQGVTPKIDARLTDWANAHNPFFSGPNADMLSMIPFAIITILLYLTGREVILGPKKQEE